MHSGALVKLALRDLGSTQKELASQIGVSAAQITKWKQGEPMSFEMENRFRILTQIGDRDPEVVYAAGSIGDTDKWQKLIDFLAKIANENAETGYITYPLEDEIGVLISHVFNCLDRLGAKIPSTFPEDLDVDYEKIFTLDEEASDEIYNHIVTGNKISSSIYKAFLVLNDLWGFFAAYIEGLIDEAREVDIAGLNHFDDIEPCLIDLAFGKADLDASYAPNKSMFSLEITENYKSWLTDLKRTCVKAQIPITVEPMKLILDDHNSLGHDAEFVSLGFDKDQIHPDIYMNEILCTLRTINHVLPAIVKKLNITEEELNLNALELRLK
ncbi:hypothetical protein IMCC21906_00026 [Spongiibacter sp. IMCC21906]|uniref:helix-turn-helix domain-containing protein n=1 Tax=Spongiibacter sp. IMCC21906 TaxID=1620392 RepID=UPI00062DCA16|nr:helix-turn-helix transcriptional regulator [Spongiibacter sp. IMCC21906]AKH67721.1 hypothetical protein IMCC21906_00026 [Spongiibacter sp. IMCC21906]